MKSQDRYSRQILFQQIGEEGQRRLAAARVLVVGCGALGSAQMESLARAGIGHLRFVDRDFVESRRLAEIRKCGRQRKTGAGLGA